MAAFYFEEYSEPRVAAHFDCAEIMKALASSRSTWDFAVSGSYPTHGIDYLLNALFPKYGLRSLSHPPALEVSFGGHPFGELRAGSQKPPRRGQRPLRTHDRLAQPNPGKRMRREGRTDHETCGTKQLAIYTCATSLSVEARALVLAVILAAVHRGLARTADSGGYGCQAVSIGCMLARTGIPGSSMLSGPSRSPGAWPALY